MKKRIISLLLVLCMLLGVLPTNVLAVEGQDTSLGKVRVIVENTTALPAPNGGYGTWETGATQWSGVHIDTQVDLTATSTALTCLNTALEGHTSDVSSTGYIKAIDGLKCDDANYNVGWMYTLNDWFTYDLMPNYTAAAGNLRDGDVIRVMYTIRGGSDLGGDYSSTDKKLASLTVDGLALKPSFSGATASYELALGEAASAEITLNAAAANKNYLVGVFKGEMTVAQAKALGANTWYNHSSLLRLGKRMTVEAGDVISIVVGAPNWDSMCNGEYGCNAENVDPCVYTLRVVKTASDTDAPLNAFFTGLSGVATVANDETYPMRVDGTENALVSTNAGVGNSESGITLTFLKTAEFSFSFKASSESNFDYLKITHNDTALNSAYADKVKYSGAMTEYATDTIKVEAGDTLRLAYCKDSSGDKNSDCVWLKDFAAVLPNKVVFHANDGTDTTAEQGVFGTAALNANTFTREGYRFDGWATTADGEVAYADGASITLSGADVNLYAVWTKVWNVTFPNMPTGAAVTVKQNGTVLEPSETADTWRLPDGSYTYDASLFGYESKQNVAFTVNGADFAVQDTLTAMPKQTVTFRLNGLAEGASATITLCNSENTVMAATEENPLVYELPTGTYTYTIAAKGYRKIKNQTLTVGAAAQTIEISMVISHVWDGTVTTPTETGGVYQIGTGAELAGFAKLVNDGETDAKAVLTADILLNEEGELTQKWTPIASTSANAFIGEFDGAGHSISGLYIDGEDAAAALFGFVGTNGSVHDLTIENASIKSTNASSSAYAALVVASNKGEVSGIKLVSSKVSGGCMVGGVAALNEGTVTGCANESAVVEQNTKKDQGVGGIVGHNKGTVSLSYNKAHIVRGHTATNYAYLGGIVGKNEGSGAVIENCYNHGEVDVAYYVGGIVGNAAGKITNCYNVGTIPSNKKPIVGSTYSATVTNCYFLDTCGASDTKGTSKTAEEFKTLASALGGAFENTETFPRLKWENPNATFSVTLMVKPANAVVTMAGQSNPTPTVANDTATYVYSGLAKGSYAWSVSCDTETADDYLPQNGTFTLSTADATEMVTLEKRTYDVTFNLAPANVSLTLKQGEQTLTPKSAASGTVVYALTMGNYHYEASAFGYNAASGDVTVAKTSGLGTQSITLTQKQNYDLTFTGLPEGATLTLTHAEGGEQTPTSSAGGTVVYHLVPETYAYAVRCVGYKTLRGTVTLEAEAKNVAVTMTALAPWDGSTVATSFAGGDGSKDAPYEIESGEELAYLSSLVASGDKLISSNTYYVLTADIDLNNKAFTPIGADSSHTFYGTFDGANHTIKNLSITAEGSNAALFGRCGASLSNLTVQNATVVGGASYNGVLAGYMSGTVTNCVVKNSTVTASGDYIGGMVGQTSKAPKGCAVLDTTVSGKNHVGGVIGQTTTNGTENCYAVRVRVTASGEYAGGVLGSTTNVAGNTKLFARGSVSAKTYAGGVLGGYVGSAYSSGKASIGNTYAVADVTATDGDAGFLVGKASSVTNSFYCTEKTLTAETQVDSGTGKTAAELKDSALLSELGAGFAIYAENGEFINAGFPYLTGAPANDKVRPTTLGAPTVTWSDKTVRWTAVEHVTAYAVMLHKGETLLRSETTTECSVDFTTDIALGGSGEYTVSVTAAGDGEFYGDSPVATKKATFEIENASVTFHVTRSDGEAFAEGRMPEITVTLADGKTTVTLENNIAKLLPLGSYTYTVSATTFATQTGSFTLTSAGATFDIALTYSPIWDGETTVEPQQIDGVYQITDGYELAWFRDEVNKATPASYALNAKLVNNIDLGGFDWTAISVVTSTSAAKGYTGTFDGNGKTVSNLKPVSESDGRGLFGYVYVGGTVKNVTVSGSMEAVKYSGGVVAILAGGTVENCVNQMNITPKETTTDGYVGGVVGYMTNSGAKSSHVVGCRNEGTINFGTAGRYIGGVVGNASNGLGIENCENRAAVSGGNHIGGVTGSASIPVTACVNSGRVTGSKARVGGIVGYANKDITNCHNSGSVTGATEVGGIVGEFYNAVTTYTVGGALIGCLNSGSISGTSGETVGALVGKKGSADNSARKTERSYYLAGTAAQAIGANASELDEVNVISQAELNSKAIIGLMGGAFASLNGTNTPVLNWQDENAKPVVTFVVTESAAVAVEGQTAVENEPNVFVLEDGTYSYTVTKTDYQTASGTLTVDGKSQSVAVTLSPVTYPVTFTVSPAGAAIVVKDKDGAVCEATSEGVYDLPKGDYSYIVSKFGFTSVNGTFTVAGQTVEIPAITLVGMTTYTVTLRFVDGKGAAVTPTAVTLTAADGTVVTPDSGFTYTLPDGTYSYVVDDSRYYKLEADFTVSGAAQNLTVTLEENRTWDGTTQTAVTPNDDNVYEIGNAAELAWFAAQVNAGNTGYDAKLIANIYINYGDSENAWTSIGSYSKQYTGTFDGNGKAVRGLDTSLFGYNGEGSLVKNVTVYGYHIGESNVGGVCNASYGGFENCVSHMSVAASGQRVGGIVGLLYSTGHITNCANFGDVTSTLSSTYGTSYATLGGIVGKSYAPITGCVNGGEVTATDDSYGASNVGGIVGELEAAALKQCYNTGAVTAAHYAGGIVGTATGADATVADSYNVGTITATCNVQNPYVGAVAGKLENRASLGNCYFLKGSYTYVYGTTDHTDEGIGYSANGNTNGTECKLASEMKLASFAIALSPTDRAFNTDSGNINGGYPVLVWQGGSTPVLSQDELDVAADKAALTVEPTIVTAPMKLNLAATGANGSAITWVSGNTEIIANDGTVTLPTANDVTVTLTATLIKGVVRDTKVFTLIVKTMASAEQSVLDAIGEKLTLNFRVPYQTGEVNVTDIFKNRVASVMSANNITGLTADDIIVTLENAGATTYGKGALIGADGKLTYYYEDPASSTVNGDAVVGGAIFKLATASGAYVTTESCTVRIAWDEAKVKAAMQTAADTVTFDAIKGENTSADEVTKNLILPQRLADYGWTLIGWTSSNANVISVTGGESLSDFTGMVTPTVEDTDVTLTATFTFNKNNTDDDDPITITKTITVTVPGAANNYRNEINAALENFKLENLKYATGASKGQVIDPNAVTDNISLPTSGVLGIDGGRNGYKIVYTASSAEGTTCPVHVDYYRGNVVRPIAEQGAAVTIMLTLTKQTGGVLDTNYTASKELTLTVAPLKPSEIAEELALLEQVKASFFDGINDGANAAQNAVTANLHAFHEAVLGEDGEIDWIYNVASMTDTGIVPTDLPGYDSMSANGWRAFRSSNPSVIAHENLLVTCPQTDDAEVTVTACLKSVRFGGYYDAYKDDVTYGPIFKRLAGEEVSVTLTVISKDNQQKARDAQTLIAAIGTVTLDSKSAIDAARAAYDALTDGQRVLVTNYATLTAAEAAYAELNKAFGNPFSDVPEKMWYHSYVMKIAQSGLIKGYSDGTFRPENNLTRAETVTLLYRLAGEPKVTGKPSFTDLPYSWYRDAIAWAEQQGVVTGVGAGKFAPELPVTREEFVTMLYRFGGAKKTETDLTQYGFEDTGKVNGWALDAMKWAVANKIIGGTTFSGKRGVYLAPQDNLLRSEAAKILCVYSEPD